jgi:hypothetical protein
MELIQIGKPFDAASYSRSPFDELIQIGKPFDAASHTRSLFDGVNTDVTDILNGRHVRLLRVAVAILI